MSALINDPSAPGPAGSDPGDDSGRHRRRKPVVPAQRRGPRTVRPADILAAAGLDGLVPAPRRSAEGEQATTALPPVEPSTTALPAVEPPTSRLPAVEPPTTAVPAVPRPAPRRPPAPVRRPPSRPVPPRPAPPRAVPSPSVPTPVAAPGRRAAPQPAPVPAPEPSSAERRSPGRRSAAVHLGVLAVAAGLWAFSMGRIDLAALDDYGLVSVLPVTFLVALGTVVGAFAWAVVRRGTPPWVAQLHVLALVVFLHGTAMLNAVPKFAYAYKHLAVIDYIQTFGDVHRNIDIYHNWPGLFAAVALVSDVSGIPAPTLANGMVPFFMLCHVLAVRYLARGLTRDPRRVAATMFVFVLGSWLAPTYVAPQSLGYFLTLVIVGTVVRFVPSRPGPRRGPLGALSRGLQRGTDRLTERFRVLRALTERDAVQETTSFSLRAAGPPRALAVALVLAMAAAIVVSHQLTPFFLVVALSVLAFLRRAGSWWLPVAVVALTVGQIVLSWDYVAAHQTLFTFDAAYNLANSGTSGPGPGSAGHQFVGLTSRVLSVLLVLAAGLGWFLVGRHRRESWILLLALTPATLILVQSYGGEGVYRIYVFMCPWLAYLASGLLAAPVHRLRSRAGELVRIGATTAAGLVATALLLFAGFGLDRVNAIQPQEVDAARWFESTATPGSLLTMLMSNYPIPLTARYSAFLTADYRWGGEIMSDPRFVGRALTAADVPAVLQAVDEWRGQGQSAYIAIGPSQIAYAEGYGFAPPGTLQAFTADLVRDPRVRIAFQEGDAVVLEVRPPG